MQNRPQRSTTEQVGVWAGVHTLGTAAQYGFNKLIDMNDAVRSVVAEKSYNVVGFFNGLSYFQGLQSANIFRLAYYLARDRDLSWKEALRAAAWRLSGDVIAAEATNAACLALCYAMNSDMDHEMGKTEQAAVLLAAIQVVAPSLVRSAGSWALHKAGFFKPATTPLDQQLNQNLLTEEQQARALEQGTGVTVEHRAAGTELSPMRDPGLLTLRSPGR